MEKLLIDRKMHCLNIRYILNYHQYGFKTLKSKTDAILWAKNFVKHHFTREKKCADDTVRLQVAF